MLQGELLSAAEWKATRLLTTAHVDEPVSENNAASILEQVAVAYEDRGEGGALVREVCQAWLTAQEKVQSAQGVIESTAAGEATDDFFDGNDTEFAATVKGELCVVSDAACNVGLALAKLLTNHDMDKDDSPTQS